jgi:hypothetical protein
MQDKEIQEAGKISGDIPNKGRQVGKRHNDKPKNHCPRHKFLGSYEG